MKSILQVLVRLLPVADREAILGDLCECDITGIAAVIALCNLIVRRAWQPYRSWRVWLSLAAAVPVSFLLIGIAVSAATQFHAWRLGDVTSFASLVELIRFTLLLCIVPVLEGFAAFSFSRTAWPSLIFVLLLTSSLCFHSFRMTDASAWSVFLYLPAVALGAWLAHRRVRVTRGDAIGWIVLLVAILWPPAGANASQWFNGLLLLLPVLLCFITVAGRERHELV